MKIFYALLMMLCIGNLTFSQTQRVMLFEEFTGEDCGPCAAANPGVNALLNINEGSVIGLKYQRIVSSSSKNVLYSQTSSETGARSTYYSNSSIPTGVLDGNVKKANAAVFDQSDFDNRSTVTSPFNLSVSHDFSDDGDSIFIQVNIEASQAFSALKSATLKLRVAMVEREITLSPPALNGESLFLEVMRKMYPNPSGTTLAQNWSSGQTQTVNFRAKIPAYIFDKNQIAIVAFIQDDDSKEVHQAARSPQKQVRVDAKLDAYNGSFLNCKVNSFEPKVTLKNNGTDYITSLEMDVKVDGNFVVTKSWSGSLAPGGQATVTLDPIAKVSGTHTIQVIAYLPNAEKDQNTFNDTIRGAFSFPDAPVPFPVAEDFESGIPASFIIENPDLGETWKESAYSANGNGSKSALIRFYAIPEGSVDYLYLPTLDLTGADFAKLSFDRAHVRYNSNFNDRCDIEGSKDCGKTWITLWSKKGVDLASAANSTTELKPTASQWAADFASLDFFAGESEVYVRFKAISDYGNNLYIDNINVESTTSSNGGPQKPTGIEQILLQQYLSVQPNPAKNFAKVHLAQAIEHAKVKVFDVRGVELMSASIENSDQLTLDTGNLAPGLYFVQLTSNGLSAKKSFVIQ